MADRRRLTAVQRAATSSVTSCLQGTVHQGDDRFSDNNRGRQCTAISLTSLILAQEKSPVYWTPADLDTIVVEGDSLYGQHRGTHDYLMPSDLPVSLIKGTTHYDIEYHDGFCGNFHLLRSSDPFYTVDEALIRSQAVSPYTFMVLGQFDCAYTSMIMNLGPVTGYYVFDSHARDTQGLPDGDGTACLIRCANMTQVVAYIHHLATTIGVHHIEQFELVPCTIKRATADSTFYENVSTYIQRQRTFATQQDVEKFYPIKDEEADMANRTLKRDKMKWWRKKTAEHKNELRKRHELTRNEAEPKRIRRERESKQRANVSVKEARKIQRQTHDENQAVKNKRKTRESVKRSEPTVKKARRTRENIQRLKPTVKKARRTRENIQRSEPTVRKSRRTRENIQRSEPTVRKSRRTRENIQRSEPTVKKKRTIQRKSHDENQTVKQKRKVREAVQRSEQTVKEVRKTRENIQRSEPTVKKSRRTRENIQRSEPTVREARKRKEALLRAKPQNATKRTQQDKTRRVVEKLGMKEIDNSVKSFNKNTSMLPKYVCCVCDRIRYKDQTVAFSQSKYDKYPSIVIDCGISQDATRICLYCHNSMNKGQIPSIAAIGNNLRTTDMPSDLKDLNTLERFLLTPVIPFMCIVNLPRGFQQGIHGPVVCVKSDLQKVATSLPRNPDDSGLIKVKLKRKLRYKGHHLYKQVRSEKVLKALQHLKQHHDRFKGKTTNIEIHTHVPVFICIYYIYNVVFTNAKYLIPYSNRHFIL